MRFAAKVLLFSFFIFLSTPTIVGLIEENSSISFFFSDTDLEDLYKDVKLEFCAPVTSIALICQNKLFSVIISENLSKHDNIFSSIFIPPPDLI